MKRIYAHGLVGDLLGFETVSGLYYPACNNHVYLMSLDQARVKFYGQNMHRSLQSGYL